MRKPSFYEIAEAKWPEDEAYSLAMDIRDNDMDEGEITRAIAHMHSVFSRESDAADLIRRFDTKLTTLTLRS